MSTLTWPRVETNEKTCIADDLSWLGSKIMIKVICAYKKRISLLFDIINEMVDP